MSDLAAARVMMVDRQVRPSDVTSFPVIEAMLHTPRERFAPASAVQVAYMDAPIAIGGGREMLEPRAFAKMIDAAGVGPDDLVLDLAPGYGYSTAVLSRMAAAVIAIEPDEDMARAAEAALEAEEIDNAMLRAGDAATGDPDHGPFDAIFVNGAVETVPEALADQLKDGGRLVAIRMNGRHGEACVFTKGPGGLQARPIFDAMAPVLPGFERAEEFAF